jgi:iron transport multicopper oxidase
MRRFGWAFALAMPWSSLAATVSYDFSIEWVRANPDGAFERPTIGINGQWPIPQIEANVGDTILVNAHNNLGNQTTSLHFHGLFMNGSNHMDGPSQVTQCPIPPGSSFLYNFTVCFVLDVWTCLIVADHSSWNVLVSLSHRESVS